MKCPDKPKTMKEQVEMLWDAVYNHIPTRLKWQDVKLNFILVFLTLILGFLAALTILIVI